MIGLDRAPAQRRRGAARAARLLRRDQLPRRARRRGARRARRDGARGRHARRLHVRPRRAAGRARPLVQDVVPRGLLARAADRARSGPDGRGACTAPVSQLDLAPTLAELRRRRGRRGGVRGHAASPARCAGESGGPGRGPRRVPRRGRAGARGDDPARPAQVHPLPRRPRPAVRPRERSARAAQPRGAIPTARGLAAAFRAESDERWDLAELERDVLAEPARAAPRRPARWRAAPTRPGTSSRTPTRRCCTCAARPRAATGPGDPGPPGGLPPSSAGADLDERRVGLSAGQWL